jgi:hypothetical protein
MAEAIIEDVPFIVVYPRIAMGLTPEGVVPPGSAEEAAKLMATCNMTALARFIEGGDDDKAQTAALREAQTVLQRYCSALHANISLAAGSREEAGIVRRAIAAAAPLPSAVWAGAGGGPAVVGAFDPHNWFTNEFAPMLRVQVHDMAYGMAAECNDVELGRHLALLSDATGPEVGVKPATQFTGAAATALARMLPSLLSHEAYDGHELYERICWRMFAWDGAAPAVPPLLAFGWLEHSGPLPPDNPLVPPEAQPWHRLVKTVVNGVFLTTQRNIDEAVAAGALDADTAACAHTRVAALREAMFAAARSLVIRMFGRLDDSLFWAGPDRAARDAARDFTCKVLERALKGKQAAMATSSAHKSVKDTKLGKVERAVPACAAHAAAAFKEHAVTALLKAAEHQLLDKMKALVVLYTDHLRNGGVMELPQRSLWAALQAYAAATDLEARIGAHCALAAAANDGAGPATVHPAPAPSAPQQLLPFPILARLVPKLASFLSEDAPKQLGKALDVEQRFHVIALAQAAKAEASHLAREAAGSSAAVSAASTAEQWCAWANAPRAPDEREHPGRASMAAMVAHTLRALLPAFDAAAPIGSPSDPLIRFLSDPSNGVGGGSDGTDADATTSEHDWSVAERFCVLSVCQTAAAELGTAAWPPVGDSLTQCGGGCGAWVARVSALYNAEASSRRDASYDEAAAAEHAAAREAGRSRALLPKKQHTAPCHWVGARVSKCFKDEQGERPFGGWVSRVTQSGPEAPLFMVCYDDDDSEEMTLDEVKHFAVGRYDGRRANPCAAAAEADASAGEWRTRTPAEVFALLSALQASVGSGPEALRELRERYSPSPLSPEDGWVIDSGQLRPPEPG